MGKDFQNAKGPLQSHKIGKTLAYKSWDYIEHFDPPNESFCIFFYSHEIHQTETLPYVRH